MTRGNGCEAWRFLNIRNDPLTDDRFASLIMAIVNFKIKGKDIQSGLVQWEQLILSLEQDHEEKLSPKLRRAFLMNVLPSWMQGKFMEHLDRIKSYAEVREKVVSLCHTCSGDAPDCQQLEQEWQQEYDGDDYEEEEPDFQALNGTCHNCGGALHFA